MKMHCLGTDSILHRSLLVAMCHPSCVNSSWMKPPRKKISCSFKSPSDDDCLYWMDEEDQELSIAFPAILDIDGMYGHCNLDRISH